MRVGCALIVLSARISQCLPYDPVDNYDTNVAPQKCRNYGTLLLIRGTAAGGAMSAEAYRSQAERCRRLANLIYNNPRMVAELEAYARQLERRAAAMSVGAQTNSSETPEQHSMDE
jgi:hypothetical protein